MIRLSKKDRLAIAKRLSRDIRVASALVTNAANVEGKQQAKDVMIRKLSTALVHCSEYFTVVAAEWNRQSGTLLHIETADGGIVRIPLFSLSLQAQIAGVRYRLATSVKVRRQAASSIAA